MAVPSSNPDLSASARTAMAALTQSNQTQGTSRRVLFYPQEGPTRRLATVVLEPADPPTLRSREIDCFDVSPTRCDDCYLPCCQHESLPGIGFSLLLSCPHITDLLDAEILAHNEALMPLLGDRGLPCLGNVVVVKHHFRPGLEASNLDLPILDIDPPEFHIVDEILLQWLTKLSGLPEGDAYFYPPDLVGGRGR